MLGAVRGAEGVVGFQRVECSQMDGEMFMNKLALEWGSAALGSKDYKENSEMKSSENNKNGIMTALSISFLLIPLPLVIAAIKQNYSFSGPRNFSELDVLLKIKNQIAIYK